MFRMLALESCFCQITVHGSLSSLMISEIQCPFCQMEKYIDNVYKAQGGVSSLEKAFRDWWSLIFSK